MMALVAMAMRAKVGLVPVVAMVTGVAMGVYDEGGIEGHWVVSGNDHYMDTAMMAMVRLLAVVAMVTGVARGALAKVALGTGVAMVAIVAMALMLMVAMGALGAMMAMMAWIALVAFHA